MVHPTQGISFPRSGHAVLWHAIRRYFGKPMCRYGSVLENPEYIWAKHHDHHGEFPKFTWLRHVAQYRNPVRSIVSNYHLYANNTRKDTRHHWENFTQMQVVSWRRFARKWLIDNQIHASLLVPYEQLVTQPLQTLKQIFEFMTDAPVDEERIIWQNISPRNNLEAFKYYDPSLFSQIEEALAPEMKALALPTYKDSV